MSFKECLYKALRTYFVVATLITAAVLVIGLAADPGARFGYEAFATPLKYAAITVLPSFVMLSKNELSIAQFIIRKIIQLVIVEGEIIALFVMSDDLNIGSANLGLLAASVLAVFVLAHLVIAANDYFTARKLTSGLARIQKRTEE